MRSEERDKAERHRAYAMPSIRLVLFECDDELLQGIIDVSGEPEPGVDPNQPDDPDNPDLVGQGSVWDS